MSLRRSPDLIAVAKHRCRELRKKETDCERIFWNAVRDRKLLGKKFYRQYPLFVDFDGRETFFIADFYCFECKLVVEIDGEVHDHQQEQDEVRTFIINKLNIVVVRFSNSDIKKRLADVLTALEKKLESLS